jgi:ABC-type lipoprotein release transport system permease subunit
VDPFTFIVVPSILVLVAMCAAVYPAWRVMQSDPITALRSD